MWDNFKFLAPAENSMLGTEASIRPETGDQKCEARTTESEGLGVGEGPEQKR